jgi:hypothetical protein
MEAPFEDTRLTYLFFFSIVCLTNVQRLFYCPCLMSTAIILPCSFSFTVVSLGDMKGVSLSVFVSSVDCIVLLLLLKIHVLKICESFSLFYLSFIFFVTFFCCLFLFPSLCLSCLSIYLVALWLLLKKEVFLYFHNLFKFSESYWLPCFPLCVCAACIACAIRLHICASFSLFALSFHNQVCFFVMFLEFLV